MSISSLQRDVASIQKAIADLEKKLADETKKENDRLKKINDINRSITKNTSFSTLQSKQNQVIKLHDEIGKIQTKKADLSKKIADKNSQLFKKRENLSKEESKQRKAIQDQEKKLRQERESYESGLRNQLSPPMYRLRTPLGASMAASEVQPDKKYDVFISHASEDKDEIARPLAEELTKQNFQVWFDEMSLRIGDNLRRNIDRGLVNSRYGVVIISSNFFAKQWPQYELDGLVQRQMNEEKVILPIWHKVTKDEVLQNSPSLADLLALNTSFKSIQEIANEIADVLKQTG